MLFKNLKRFLFPSVLLGFLLTGNASVPVLAQEDSPTENYYYQTITVYQEMDGVAYTGDDFTVVVENKETGEEIGTITHFEEGIGSLEVQRSVEADIPIVIFEASNSEDYINYDQTEFETIIDKVPAGYFASGEVFTSQLALLPQIFNAETFTRSATPPSEDATVVYVQEEGTEFPIPVWYDEESRALFYYCEMPIVYLNEDSSEMFVSELKTIDLTETDGTLIKNATYMFANNNELQNVLFPDNFGSSATDLSYMFYGCSYLASIELPIGFGQEAINCHYLFANCAGLESISLPAGFGQNAEDLSGLFYACNHLKSMVLPAGCGSKALDINRIFYSCEAIETIEFPDDFGKLATDGSWAFKHCWKLKNLTMKEGFGQNCLNLEEMFFECESIESITLPDGFGASATNVNHLFVYSPYLKYVFFPTGFGQSLGEDIGFLFFNSDFSNNIEDLGFGEGFDETLKAIIIDQAGLTPEPEPEPTGATFPDMTGQTEQALLDMITALQMQVGYRSEEYSDEYEAGIITYNNSGDFDYGYAIDYTVSLGSEPMVTVPDFSGQPESAILAFISENHLNGNRSEDYSSDYASGIIIHNDTDDLYYGSYLFYTVSLGPQP